MLKLFYSDVRNDDLMTKIKKNQYKPLSYKRQLYVILIYIQAKGVAVRKTFTEFC